MIRSARFAVHGFNHTSFTVASLDRAIPFFCDLLGFELISRAPRGQALIEKMTAISAADVSDMWIHEGWTTYLESMYVERLFGHDDAIRYVNSYKSKVQNREPVITQVDAAVAAALAYDYRRVGEIIVIDDGPNRGRQVVYLKGPDSFVIEFIGARPA